MESLSKFARPFFFVLSYVFIFYLIQVFLSEIGFFQLSPGETNLGRWDSPIYYGINIYGCNSMNSGCYPLLGWVWRIFSVGYFGMAMINIVFFAIAIAILANIYEVSMNELFLWLTTPSLYFMLVPYTEALFCMLTVLAFYGIIKHKHWLTFLALFFASLTRATGLFMLPSLLVMQLVSHSPREVFKSLGAYFLVYALPILLATVWFVVLQHHVTGIWFAYFKGQATNLGHKWSLPGLDFTNLYGTAKVLWLCAFALLVCFIAFLHLVAEMAKWVTKSNKNNGGNKLYILSLCYLSVVMITMVFCNPKWDLVHTDLLGIHRYTFCSPFIFVVLYEWVSKARRYTWNNFLMVFLLCNLVWLTFGSYLHIHFLLFYNFITLIVLGYMLHANKKGSWPTYALCALNLFFQLHLFQYYILGLFTD